MKPPKFVIKEYEAHVPRAKGDEKRGRYDIHVSDRDGWCWTIYGLYPGGVLRPGEDWHSTDKSGDEGEEVLTFGQDYFKTARLAQAAALLALKKLVTELKPKTCDRCRGTGSIPHD